MSYTHQKVSWKSCNIVSYEDALMYVKDSARRFVVGENHSVRILSGNPNPTNPYTVNEYGDIIRQDAKTIIARKQPHEEVITVDVGKEVLTKNIYYVDPRVEPNALSIAKYDLLDNELIVNIYKMCDHYNRVKMIRFITV